MTPLCLRGSVRTLHPSRRKSTSGASKFVLRSSYHESMGTRDIYAFQPRLGHPEWPSLQLAHLTLIQREIWNDTDNMCEIEACMTNNLWWSRSLEMFFEISTCYPHLRQPRHFNDQLLRNPKGCNTTAPITINAHMQNMFGRFLYFLRIYIH